MNGHTKLNFYTWIGRPWSLLTSEAIRAVRKIKSKAPISTECMPEPCDAIGHVIDDASCPCQMVIANAKALGNFYAGLDRYLNNETFKACGYSSYEEARDQLGIDMDYMFKRRLEHPNKILGELLENCNLDHLATALEVLSDDQRDNAESDCHNPNNHQVEILTPHDPNDILGYVAESGSHYVGVGQKQLNYTIEFENDSTLASAPAHTILVKDELDTSVFDINSIHTSKITIGKYEIDVDRYGEFLTTIDMRPAINALAEVKLTTNNYGEIVYAFTSLDPMTVEPTNDIMAGILPINNSNKNGEGYINFEVKLKDNLKDGTPIDNSASIVFDANEAIQTPVWSNETDYVLPVSYVSNITSEDDEHITLEFDGIDERSGIWKYDLYYQPGYGSAWYLVKEDLRQNTYSMEVFKDIDYGFCVIATDMAGNKEVKDLARECSYMNGNVVTGVEVATAESVSSHKRVYDLSGRRVRGKLKPGMYVSNGKKIIIKNIAVR